MLQYCESSDPKVIEVRVDVKTGRKWRAEAAAEGAEVQLQHKVLVGAVAKGKFGLGSLEVPHFNKAQGRERRQLIQDYIRAVVEEERMSRAVAMRQQGAWTRWEQVMERKITWNDLWRMDSESIKFLIKAVYDILPSPSNLHRWGLEEQTVCPLCERIGTL